MQIPAINHSVGLVMEGGGMRGLFTSGVIDVLMEQGINFPCSVGVSAGACFGINIKSLQPGRVLRYNLQMIGNPHYMSWRSLFKTGDYANAEFCYHTVPMEIDIFDTVTYAQMPTHFHIVCTDIDTGKPVYHEIERINYEELEWLRASASLPMVAQPVQLGGMRLMDGGLSDSIPLRYIQQLGYDRNLVILTQPLGYRKKQSKAMGLYRLLLRKYPKMVELLENRPQMYNEELAFVEEQTRLGKVLLIAPPQKLDIGRVEQNPKKLQQCYDWGREAALAKLNEIQAFLQ